MSMNRKIQLKDISEKESDINDYQIECSLNTFLWQNNLDRMYEIAINYFNRKISFKELRDNIWRTARALIKTGIGPGDVVTICSEMTPEVIFLFYAMDLMGAIPDMMNPNSRCSETRHLIERTESKIVFCLDTAYPMIQKAIIGTLVGKVIVISKSDSIKGLKRSIYQIKHKTKNQYDANVVMWQDFFWLGMDPLDELSVIGYAPERIAGMLAVEIEEGEMQKVLIATKIFNKLAIQNRNCGYDRSRRYVHGMPPYEIDGLIRGVHAPLSIGVCSVIIEQEMRESSNLPDDIGDVDDSEPGVITENEISTYEIENMIDAHFNVYKSIVVHIQNDEKYGEKMPFVFIKWHDESTEMRKKSMSEVRKFCEENLSGEKIPKAYASIKVIPVAETGMIDRHKLEHQAKVIIGQKK